MIISVFTPAHRATWLDELYDSLLCQGDAAFEWVLCPNGPLTPSGIPERIRRDCRVRVIDGAPNTDRIGALKRFAVDQCHGDVFLEADQDDLLFPLTLPKVAAAFEAGAGFVYSDVAVFHDGSLAPHVYLKEWGWETYPVEVYGRRLLATRNFDITPRSLCQVHFAPDHLRAWSRKAYYTAGGHDSLLAVGDDHDLVCRTYLTGAEFKHTGGCGYLYREHGKNTVHLKNKMIQDQSEANSKKYLPGLIAEWCKRHKHGVLDLLSESKNQRWHADRVAMMTIGPRLPRPGHIIVSDMLQFASPKQIVPFFNEAYNHLVPGGFLTVTVPSTNGRYADQNPMHLTRFNYNTFLHFTNRSFAANMPGVNCRFDMVRADEFYPNKDFEMFDMKVLKVELSALKGQRHPGLVHI